MSAPSDETSSFWAYSTPPRATYSAACHMLWNSSSTCSPVCAGTDAEQRDLAGDLLDFVLVQVLEHLRRTLVAEQQREDRRLADAADVRDLPSRSSVERSSAIQVRSSRAACSGSFTDIVGEAALSGPAASAARRTCRRRARRAAPRCPLPGPGRFSAAAPGSTTAVETAAPRGRAARISGRTTNRKAKSATRTRPKTRTPSMTCGPIRCHRRRRNRLDDGRLLERHVLDGQLVAAIGVEADGRGDQALNLLQILGRPRPWSSASPCRRTVRRRPSRRRG